MQNPYTFAASNSKQTDNDEPETTTYQPMQRCMHLPDVCPLWCARSLVQRFPISILHRSLLLIYLP